MTFCSKYVCTFGICIYYIVYKLYISKHKRSTRCVRCTSAKCVVYSHLATHAVKCTLFLYSYIYIFLLTQWRCRNRVLLVDVCTTCIYHNKVKPKANGKQTLSSSEHRLNTTVLDTREYSISPASRTSFTITTIPYLLYHSRLYMLVKSCFVIIMFLFAIETHWIQAPHEQLVGALPVHMAACASCKTGPDDETRTGWLCCASVLVVYILIVKSHRSYCGFWFHSIFNHCQNMP